MSHCTTPGVGVGVGISKKFNVKVFYVMDKALSGELSRPCDRSCFLSAKVLCNHRLSGRLDLTDLKSGGIYVFTVLI